MAPPEKAARWPGVPDASQFGPSCPQPDTPFVPLGAVSEDCLRLNVYTPGAVLRGEATGGCVDPWRRVRPGRRPQLRPEEPGRGRDRGRHDQLPPRSARVLAHPALASEPGGPSGDYGIMDQQAAIRWVQNDVRAFGGDPSNVTIAGESAGGLSVLMHMVSQGSQGLFHKAIVQSGSFAMTQLPHSAAEAFGRVRRSRRWLPGPDRSMLALQARGSARGQLPASGDPRCDRRPRPHRVGRNRTRRRPVRRLPVLNGMNHDEELLFVAGLGLAVGNGAFVGVPAVTVENYEDVIASTMSVSAARAANIAAQYPVEAYPVPFVALDAAVWPRTSRARQGSRTCGPRRTSRRSPTSSTTMPPLPATANCPWPPIRPNCPT